MVIQNLALISIVLVLLSSWASALSIFPGSPCYNVCDGNSPTQQSDIVCTDSDFENTEAGQILSSCLTCLHASNYQNGYLTDSTLFIYYLSSIQQSCLSNAEVTGPCTSTCSSLPDSFSNLGGRSQFQNPFSYCSINSNAYANSASQCATCLQGNGSVVLGNVVYVGELGCENVLSVQNSDTINYSGDPFNTTALGPISSSGSNSKHNSTSTSTSRTSNATATVTTSLVPDSVTVVTTATVGLSPSSAASANALSGKESVSAPLSRGAAAGIGLVLGLFGIISIIVLAMFLRRRQIRKHGASFKRMPSPTMAQRTATPPAAGVYLPSGYRSSRSAAAAAAVGAFAKTGIGKSIAKDPEPAPPPKDIGREALPKHSKSFRSVGTKSWRSKNVTPRSSAWFFAANPKTSCDLTALPQPAIVPGLGGIPEVPSSRATPGTPKTPRTPRTPRTPGRGWN